MIDLKLAERLCYLCGDLNDGHGVNMRAGNTDARLVRDPALSPNPILIFAGSNDWKDWMDNGNILHDDFGNSFGPVHGGFLRAMRRILPQVLEAIGMDDTVCLAGHSQGGAVATLMAAELLSRGYNVQWVYTFGSPRPASKAFKAAYNRVGLGAVTYRVVVGYDGVVRCPDRSCDFHLGTGHFFTENGARRDEQKRPRWYTPWRYLTKSIWGHMALSSYSTALRRAADGKA